MHIHACIHSGRTIIALQIATFAIAQSDTKDPYPTVFKTPEVINKLDDFIVVKFNAEKMGDKDIKPVLDYFKIFGLPTYVIISPPNAD